MHKLNRKQGKPAKCVVAGFVIFIGNCQRDAFPLDIIPCCQITDSQIVESLPQAFIVITGKA